jgi:signal transduction histidine kinase
MALTGAVAGSAVLAAVALGLLLRRALDDLTKTKARVEQSNHDLEAFAGRIAHDVRNALGPIAVAPAMLRADDLGAERREAICRRLEQAVERAVGLVDGLLAFSRAGQPPDPNASASIRSVVTAVLEELEPKIEQADVAVDVDVEECEVCCAPGLLHMVVANVVGNAVKFVRDQPVRRVRVRGEKVRSGYVLRVDDTGPGIPNGVREKIFEPFFRAPGTKASGTGIGLATVHRIVEAYGGWVRVDSRVGEGSSFRVCLPRADAEESVKNR